MKRLALLCCAILAGCATPVTVLKNAQGQIARCGGGMGGSMSLGYIGYSMEKANDEKCVADYEARGYRRIE